MFNVMIFFVFSTQVNILNLIRPERNFYIAKFTTIGRAWRTEIWPFFNDHYIIGFISWQIIKVVM